MRLLTAGSLVQAQQGEPEKRFSSRDWWELFVLLAVLQPPAVNCFVSLRCQWQKKRCWRIGRNNEQCEAASSLAAHVAPEVNCNFCLYAREKTYMKILIAEKRAVRQGFWPDASLVRIQQGEPAPPPRNRGFCYSLKSLKVQISLNFSSNVYFQAYNLVT